MVAYIDIIIATNTYYNKYVCIFPIIYLYNVILISIRCNLIQKLVTFCISLKYRPLQPLNVRTSHTSSSSTPVDYSHRTVPHAPSREFDCTGSMYLPGDLTDNGVAAAPIVFVSSFVRTATIRGMAFDTDGTGTAAPKSMITVVELAKPSARRGASAPPTLGVGPRDPAQ